MMDENLAMWLSFAAMAVLLTIIFGAMLLWSEANFRGWEEGRRENERYHRHTVDVLKGRIEAREHALAMSMDMLATLCDNISDCKYCPYGCDDYSRKCALWELSEQVDRFGIKKVHVDTRHDGVDAMSDYFLCDYCDNQHDKENTYEWTEMCDAGEIEPKVMHDHHGRDGKRYDEPTQVCEHYVPKGK